MFQLREFLVHVGLSTQKPFMHCCKNLTMWVSELVTVDMKYGSDMGVTNQSSHF